MAAKIFWLISLLFFLLIYQTIYGQPVPKDGDTVMGSGLWLLFLLAVFVATLVGLTFILAWYGCLNWISANKLIRWSVVFFSSLTIVGAIIAAVLTQENINSLAQNGSWLSFAFRLASLLLLAAYGLLLFGKGQWHLLAAARWMYIASGVLSIIIWIILIPKLLG